MTNNKDKMGKVGTAAAAGLAGMAVGAAAATLTDPKKRQAVKKAMENWQEKGLKMAKQVEKTANEATQTLKKKTK